VFGFIIGIARLSPNWLVARIGSGYVEIIRNLPLLFQILFWYLAVLGTCPPGTAAEPFGYSAWPSSTTAASSWPARDGR